MEQLTSACHWLGKHHSMSPRTVWTRWEEIRWASLWTDWFVWPYGLTCSEDLLNRAAAPGKLPGNLVSDTSPVQDGSATFFKPEW